MKLYNKLLFYFIALVICGCNITADQKNNKGKLFIIGGGSKPTSMVQKMIDESEIHKNGYGVVLPMASSVPDTSAYYGKLQFQEQGILDMHAFNFADSTLPNVDQKLDSLRRAELVYIPGGVQSRFMEAVSMTNGLEQSIKEAYSNGALIAGTSAGAAVMSQIIITGDQRKYPEYTPTFYHLEKNNIVTQEGLGLITDIIVDQHFIKRARNNRLLTAVMEFPGKTGIGIDESTAIILQGNQAEVVGESQVLIYQNNSDSVAVNEGKVGARDIKLQIYLPGQSFSLTK